MSDRAIVKNAAGDQDQAGIHLTLWLLIAATGIDGTEPVDIKIVFVEIGSQRIAFPCPDPLLIFAHIMRDKGIRRCPRHHGHPFCIRGKQAEGDALIGVNLRNILADRDRRARRGRKRRGMSGKRRARQRQSEVNSMSFHR